jgi:hypothetical protein
MPTIAVLAPTTRDCGARVTASCEQTTTDPDAICRACADQLDGFLAVDVGVPF